MNSVCRLCIKNNTDISLNCRDINNIELLDKLKFIVPEIVNENDGLSNYICTTCYNALDQAYTFKKDCVDIYEKFKSNSTIQQSFDNALKENESATPNESLSNFLSNNEDKAENNDANSANSIHIVLDANMQNYILKLVDQGTNSNHSDTVIDLNLEHNNNTNQENEPNTTAEQEVDQSEKVTSEKDTDTENPKENKLVGKRKRYISWKSVPNPQDFTEFEAYNPAYPKIKVSYVKDVSSNTFTCKTCNKNFNKFPSLYTHLNRKHFDNLEDIATKTNHSQSTDIMPRNIYILPSLFSCNFCEFMSQQKQLFEEHMSRKHTYRCSRCLKVFHHESELEQHSKMHITKYKCKICSKAFKNAANLKRHMDIHAGLRQKEQIKCDRCDFKCVSKFIYNRHLFIKHNEKMEQQFKCDICTKPYASLKNLTSHKQIHELEKEKDGKFTCNVCGWVGKRAFGLAIHMRMHTTTAEERKKTKKKRKKKVVVPCEPLPCPICNKMISNKYMLRQHVKKHNTENWKYKCDYCGKKYFNKAEFTIHVRIHTGERPFKCELCDRTFYMKSNLNKHMDTHTGIKRFICDICGNKYSQSSSLKEHRLKVHNDT